MNIFDFKDWFQASQSRPRVEAALSSKPSLEAAVKEVSEKIASSSRADLAMVFVSSYFASDLPRLLPLLQERLQADNWIGCVGSGVIGTDSLGNAQELENQPALSLTLLSLPGSLIQAFSLDLESLPDLDGCSKDWEVWVGTSTEDNRGMILFADPTTSGIKDLISGLDYAYPQANILGGIAGIHNAPHGSLFFQDKLVSGVVGCAIGGDWDIESVVSQGCKPIGPVFEIEQVQKNVLLQLSHNDLHDSPVAFLQRMLQELSEDEKDLLKDSLFLGVEHCDLLIGGSGTPRSQASFLIRNLIGVDPSNGAVAVAETMRVGQNVQFQLREADSSVKEAEQLFEAAVDRTSNPPVFALLIACVGRGHNLFGKRNVDVSIAQSAFPELPIAGAFCNGEIGALGATTHIHGYSACWGLLRHSPRETTIDPN